MTNFLLDFGPKRNGIQFHYIYIERRFSNSTNVISMLIMNLHTDLILTHQLQFERYFLEKNLVKNFHDNLTGAEPINTQSVDFLLKFIN